MNSWHIAMLLIKRSLWRKRGVVSFLLVPALVVSLIIGILDRFYPMVVSVDIVNRDSGGLGRILTKEWEANPEFSVTLRGDEETGGNRVIRHLSEALLVIPESFTEDVLAGRSPQVELKHIRMNEAVYQVQINLQSEVRQLAETADRLRGTEKLDNGAFAERISQIYEEKAAKGSRLRLSSSGINNGEKLSSSIGILILFIMGLATSSVTLLLDDRKNKTLQRIFATPVRSFEIMAGNFLGCFVIGTLQILFVLTVTRLVTDYDFDSDFVPLLAVLEAFLLAAMGIASAVAALMQKSDNGGVVHTMIITPTCMLGGCFWPIPIMPEYMQKLANFVPQKWAIEAVNGLSKGASWADLSYPLSILVLFGIVLLSFGAAVLRPGEDTLA